MHCLPEIIYLKNTSAVPLEIEWCPSYIIKFNIRVVAKQVILYQKFVFVSVYDYYD